MRTVAASEFQRNFGKYKEVAQREPVTVTANGRDSVVLISAADYAAYKASLQSQEISGTSQKAFDHALANAKLEGLEPSPEGLKILENIRDGHLSFEDGIAAIKESVLNAPA